MESEFNEKRLLESGERGYSDETFREVMSVFQR